MELVEKNMGLVPQNRNNQRQWLQKCNKQCLKLVTNQFKKKNKKPKVKQQPPITNMPSFDSSLNMGPTFDPAMPLPKNTTGQQNDTDALFQKIQIKVHGFQCHLH